MNPKDLVGAKKAALRYVPPAVEIEASGPMEDGAKKYGPYNWREQPVSMMTYIEAIKRHLAALIDGEDTAQDSGHSHVGHIIAGAGIIADAKANGTLIDDRPAKGPAPKMLAERDRSVVVCSQPGHNHPPGDKWEDNCPGCDWQEECIAAWQDALTDPKPVSCGRCGQVGMHVCTDWTLRCGSCGNPRDSHKLECPWYNGAHGYESHAH